MMSTPYELARAARITENNLRLAPLVDAANALAAVLKKNKQQQLKQPRKPRVTGALPARRSSRVIRQMSLPRPPASAEPVQDKDPVQAWDQVLRQGWDDWEEGQARQTADQLVKHGVRVSDIQAGIVSRDQLTAVYKFPFNVAGRIVLAVNEPDAAPAQKKQRIERGSLRSSSTSTGASGRRSSSGSGKRPTGQHAKHVELGIAARVVQWHGKQWSEVKAEHYDKVMGWAEQLAEQQNTTNAAVLETYKGKDKATLHALNWQWTAEDVWGKVKSALHAFGSNHAKGALRGWKAKALQATEESMGATRHGAKGPQQTPAPPLAHHQQQQQQAPGQRPGGAQPAAREPSKRKQGQHMEQQPQETLDQTPQRSKSAAVINSRSPPAAGSNSPAGIAIDKKLTRWRKALAECTPDGREAQELQAWIDSREWDLRQQELMAAINQDSSPLGGAAAGGSPSGGNAAQRKQARQQQQQEEQQRQQQQQPRNVEKASSRAATAAAAAADPDDSDESGAAAADTLNVGQQVYIQRVDKTVVAAATVRCVDPEFSFKDGSGKSYKLGPTYYMVDSITVSKKQKQAAKGTKVWVGVCVKNEAGTGATKLLKGSSSVMDAAELGATLPVPKVLLVPVPAGKIGR